tara:strand:+ start:66 stop:1976 length:1911 start_codon:yes stop_codon:yes gene_type:complete
MNFMNRRMFATGGSAENPYFYVDAQGETQYLDQTKLVPILRSTDITALEALIQNPDVTYSPAAQEVFRQVVGERKATFSSTDPSLFKFGEFLPDNLTGLSALRDIGGFGLDFAGQVGEGIYNLGRSVSSGFGERSVEDTEFAPQDVFPSERFPNVPDTITGRPGTDEGFMSGFDKSGILRRGYTNPQLAAILNRSMSEVQDFSEDIAAIDNVSTPVTETETVLDTELPTSMTDIEELKPLVPITFGETIGQSFAPGTVGFEEQEARRLAYQQEMIGRDEFGNIIERPDEVLLPPDIKDEIDKTLQELTPIEVLVDTNKTEEQSKAENLSKFSPPDLELAKVDLTPAPPVIPKETTGVFGSDRFLDFIRNVGSQLVATGQLGEGLATGAAKAAEERTARDLLEEQETKKFERDMDLAIAIEKIKSQGSNLLKPSELGALQEDVDRLSTNVKDYGGTEASIQIMNSAIDLFDEAIKNNVPITGLPGYAVRGIDQLKAFMGSTDENVSDSTKIVNYINQVKQRSIREILNESGRTISNLDRDIVNDVFGEINLTDKPSEIRKKLSNARENLIRNNEDKKRSIESTYSIVRNPAYQGVGINAVTPFVDDILRIIYGSAAVAQSNSSGSQQGIIDIGLEST